MNLAEFVAPAKKIVFCVPNQTARDCHLARAVGKAIATGLSEARKAGGLVAISFDLEGREIRGPLAHRGGTSSGHLGLDTKLPGLIGYDIFESIATPGKLAILASWKDAKAARTREPRSFDGVKALRHRIVRVIRDDGMFDRREAPPYYPRA